jgi:hypothetical protein
MRHLRVRALAALAVAALGLIPPIPAFSGTSSQGSAFAPAPGKEVAPFARVYLAIRGCTSCSHCRTTIRQMVRSTAQGGETRMRSDRVEIRYPTPQTVPLRDVIHTLATNRLHDLSLVDVLFEASGVVTSAKDGTSTFTMTETGQKFAVTLDTSLQGNATGRPVRLVAVVDGWRNDGTLSLHVREIHPQT